MYDVSWCPNTDLIATACGDDIVRVFKEDESSDPHAPTFVLACDATRAHSQDVNCVAWNRRVPGLLASCSDDGDVKLWKFVVE